jgi:hypothetical protein
LSPLTSEEVQTSSGRSGSFTINYFLKFEQVPDLTYFGEKDHVGRLIENDVCA